jgi:hypothetical protein
MLENNLRAGGWLFSMNGGAPTDIYDWFFEILRRLIG